jgi:hypothetical protein
VINLNQLPQFLPSPSLNLNTNAWKIESHRLQASNCTNSSHCTERYYCSCTDHSDRQQAALPSGSTCTVAVMLSSTSGCDSFSPPLTASHHLQWLPSTCYCFPPPATRIAFRPLAPVTAALHLGSLRVPGLAGAPGAPGAWGAARLKNERRWRGCGAEQKSRRR